tara:strand:- start:961 stop:1620 length:660 start_codon:yes stop_codon:yes gene_type:complete
MAGLPNIVIRPVWAGPGTGTAFGESAPTANQSAQEAVAAADSYGLAEYSDNYASNYATTNTFGRMDPIVSYSNTGREVTFGMLFEGGIGTGDVPDGNAKIGMDFAKKITLFQYPAYEGLGANSIPNALLIERPPLLFVHAGSLLSGAKNNGYQLCLLKNFAYTPTIGFTPLTAPYVQVDFKGNKAINFQSITVRFTLTVLHSQGPGWSRSGNKFSFLQG